MRSNLTSIIPSLLRSLCASLTFSGESITSKSNLTTLKAHLISGEEFDTYQINMTDGGQTGVSALLGEYFKQKYTSWSCSDELQNCTDVCVGTAQVYLFLFCKALVSRKGTVTVA